MAQPYNMHDLQFFGIHEKEFNKLNFGKQERTYKFQPMT